MLILRFAFSLLFFSFFLLNSLAAQDSISLHKKDSAVNRNLTISYDIALSGAARNKGIGETYNGGLKTVFINGNNARVRLVSLMRIQSIFLLPKTDARGRAIIVKESGKNKYKTYLSEKEWKIYNRKYDSANCILTTDSLTVLNYPCRKAIISLRDNRFITAYYTDSLHNSLLAIADPAFACIPGVVLKYEYVYKNEAISFTASRISTEPVVADVFKIPSQGYTTRRFSAAKSAD